MTDLSTAKFEAAPDVLLTELGESEACLLNTRTRYYYWLNETGQLIWKALESRRTPAGVADALRETYEIDEEGARRHVREFLDDLLRNGLITRCDDA